MSLATRHASRRIASEVDIQLWARAHRRRWLVRALGNASAALLGMAAQWLRTDPERAARRSAG